MAFYWKFTRSGKLSKDYISLIVDATPDSINPEHRIWHTSFEEIEMCLILLHDVETANMSSTALSKGSFSDAVQEIGYEPSSTYCEMRSTKGLVKGQSVMGRHTGFPLDWGYYGCRDTPIDLDITGLQVAGFVNAIDGKLCGKTWAGNKEDKLSCFRSDPNFIPTGMYYDLMPKHNVIVPLARHLLETDATRANEFFTSVLKWTKS